MRAGSTMAVIAIAVVAMAIVTVDIIVPVKNRETVQIVVETLMRELAAAKKIVLGQLLLCDGGSTEPTCLRQIETVSRWKGVRVLQCERSDGAAKFESGFNKGWVMNQGLAAATAQVVLMTDVDILWTADTLEAIALAAAHHPQLIYSVLNIRESDPTAVAVRRARYTYRIEPQKTDTLMDTSTDVLVEICPASVDGKKRPGCGIVAAQRQVFESIGGYKECFVGWGWEDQDLLIRAQLLGYVVVGLGEVVHLSHGDERRNKIAKSIEESRDRNIMRCVIGLKRHQLLGDLLRDKSVEDGSLKSNSAMRNYRNISVRYPSELGA